MRGTVVLYCPAMHSTDVLYDTTSGERVAINRKLSEERKSSLTETGVTTDAQVATPDPEP
eukprot:3745543-Rhodomonas_salina.1